MLTLPFELTTLIVAFAPSFPKTVFKYMQVLIGGAILALGKRTVTSALRVMGLSTDEHFQNYHRVLNPAVWSSLAASRSCPGMRCRLDTCHNFLDCSASAFTRCGCAWPSAVTATPEAKSRKRSPDAVKR